MELGTKRLRATELHYTLEKSFSSETAKVMSARALCPQLDPNGQPSRSIVDERVYKTPDNLMSAPDAV